MCKSELDKAILWAQLYLTGKQVRGIHSRVRGPYKSFGKPLQSDIMSYEITEDMSRTIVKAWSWKQGILGEIIEHDNPMLEE
ncbi:hypothetical protein GOP47_0013667 [Adiantum capillus-veneris]|uniref:Uncharacterized protein n=1 Tax=Adiantum capillus-veneris TaxID=13818 RepID=A0A9D4UPN4_ADICA|nr:hypothetical protein GOP47_0013667 [Adiantum capillus-veneris]